MSIDEKKLQEITLECKRALDRLDVVTPSVFASLFKQYAQEYGIEDLPENGACSEIVETQMASLVQLSQESGEKIEHLDATSKKALDAMVRGDEASLRESIDETEALRREIDRLKESVYTDPLTKAYNRQWLDAHSLDEEGRLTHPCHLAIVDLNYFKQINDTLGHIAGDKVLVYIANHLKTCGVPLVRYGGDEFLLLFEGSSETPEHIMQRCRKTLLKKKLKYHGLTFTSSFAYGIAECQEGTPFADALEEADTSMYEDKKRIKRDISPPFTSQPSQK